jgi:phenylacetate-CoA ligase
MKYAPEIEFASGATLVEFQFKKLKALLDYVSTRSSFYRALFTQHNIQVSEIKSFDDFTKVPVTTKNDLQSSNFDFLCIPKEEIAEFTATSGTLGKPVTLALSQNDIQRLAYNEAVSFTRAGGSANDLFQLMLTLDRQFMAGLAYYEGIKKIGAGVIRVGPGLPAMQWEIIERLKPTVILGVPSFVVKLLEYATAHAIDVNKTSVKKMICIGENIRSIDLRPNTLAQKITGQWNIILYGTYASTEMQTAFTECSHGAGGHLQPELLVVEILDENNRPVEHDEAGEVTITTLGVEAMPLIRYKTGDIARAHRELCACGRTTLRLGPIQGRKQHMLKLKGTTVYPPAVFDILDQEPEIQDYVVEALSGSLGTDELRIHAVADASLQGIVHEKLIARFKASLRVLPEIVFTSHQMLQNLNGSTQHRKVQKFVDSRTK